MQRPSSVSSVKINGRRAHELVREGVDVVLPERPVTVFSLEVDAVRISEGSVEADIRVHCSSGTYIRSIARDVGAELEVGGHLTALRRTSAGPFDIAEARTLDELNRQKDAVLASFPEGTDPRSVSPELSLSLDEAMVRCFPVRNVTEDQGSALALGKWLEPVGDREVVAAVTPSGHAVALLEEKGKRAASVFVARPAGME
jgi:tRNA pseudouridine55 synthase